MHLLQVGFMKLWSLSSQTEQSHHGLLLPWILKHLIIATYHDRAVIRQAIRLILNVIGVNEAIWCFRFIIVCKKFGPAEKKEKA